MDGGNGHQSLRVAARRRYLKVKSRSIFYVFVAWSSFAFFFFWSVSFHSSFSFSRGGGALWNSFACFHITALKWATEEKSFIDQMLALCSGFKIIIMKKLLGAPRGPHFFKKVSVPHCPTWGNVEHLGAF